MRIISETPKSTQSISAPEALALLTSIREERRTQEPEALLNTLKYLRACTTPGASACAERSRVLLQNAGLTDYEASQVINLCPETHTDAKAHIPSLSRIDNSTLDILLNDLADSLSLVHGG